jgi:ATP-dependent protease ClpP protease subunit
MKSGGVDLMLEIIPNHEQKGKESRPDPGPFQWDLSRQWEWQVSQKTEHGQNQEKPKEHGQNQKNQKKPEKDSGSDGGRNQEEKNEELREYGQMELSNNRERNKISLLTIIGEIEGHDCLPSTTKTTKYEHVLPRLAEIEDNQDSEGLLLLLNTVGGDVESGLAIAEMIASISKPTVSLVLGGSHSIGVPLAVSTDYSYIVPSGTMVIHPVRMNGTVIGAQPTYDYFKQMQTRILKFIAAHSGAEEKRLEELMMNTGMLTKDLGTILVGEEAVKEGLIDAVGGIDQAFLKLHSLIDERKL